MKSFLFCFIFISTITFSQTKQHIQPYVAKETRQVTAFDDLSIRKNIAAIVERDIVIYVENEKLWLAKLNVDKWNIMLLSDQFNAEKELKIEEIDIDGTGSNELVIYWEFMGKQDLLNVIVKGIQIWNIDEQLCYLDEYTTCLEERYFKDADLHIYAGCERKIELTNNIVTISAFACDMELNFEILPETKYSGKYQFKNGKFELL